MGMLHSPQYRIVLLDAFTADQGEQAFWHQLNTIGKVVRYDRSKPNEVIPRSQGADVVITNKVQIDQNILEALPDLDFIGVAATGYNIIDTEAAKNHGVAVCNVPAYSTASVAQHTLGLLLELANGTGLHGTAVANGKWGRCADFCFLNRPTRELHGSTLAIIGYGDIGQSFGRAAAGLGIKVIPTQVPGRPTSSKRVRLEEVLPQADIISLHCPLTHTTQGMVDACFLKNCKDDVILLNTSRGGLINEADLAAWLTAHPDARCGLDVLSQEPPQQGNELLNHAQALVTPHIAWATNQARKRLRDTIIANIQAWGKGQRLNRIV